MRERTVLAFITSVFMMVSAGCLGGFLPGSDSVDNTVTTVTQSETTTKSPPTATTDTTATRTQADSGGSPPSTATSAGTTVAPESVGEDPRQLIVQFYRYLDDGNTDAAGKLVHPKSPLRDGSGELFSDTESVRAMERNNVSVRSVSYLSANESRAVLTALVSLSKDTDATTIRWEVRKADGKWRIWKQAQSNKTETG